VKTGTLRRRENTISLTLCNYVSHCFRFPLLQGSRVAKHNCVLSSTFVLLLCFTTGLYIKSEQCILHFFTLPSNQTKWVRQLCFFMSVDKRTLTVYTWNSSMVSYLCSYVWYMETVRVYTSPFRWIHESKKLKMRFKFQMIHVFMYIFK
jgi:hypothetical protein